MTVERSRRNDGGRRRFPRIVGSQRTSSEDGNSVENALGEYAQEAENRGRFLRSRASLETSDREQHLDGSSMTAEELAAGLRLLDMMILGSHPRQTPDTFDR